MARKNTEGREGKRAEREKDETSTITSPPHPTPESNLIGLTMICDFTQSAVTAEASSRWLERVPRAPLSAIEITGGLESRVNVSECKTWHLYCL